MDRVCEHVANGDSLRSFCAAEGLAYRTVLDWIERDETRTAHYARARESRADLVFDALDDVSEAAVTAENAVQVAGLRLKADNIKWKLARMAPKKYGEKLELAGDPQAPIRHEFGWVK